MPKQKHIPVLAREVLELLDPQPDETYLDLTAGYGGHAKLIRERIGPSGTMTLVDRDQEAIITLEELFGDSTNVQIMHTDFASASHELLDSGAKFDLILADLGVSSVHLNNPERGFSFMNDGPLDMRMDRRLPMTAEQIVNQADQEELAEILKLYGEVKGSKILAGQLIEGRPYKTTLELANRIAALRPKRSRIHPATAVFQAIRIAVNSELSLLEASLPIWINLLNHKGRIGIISFHSLEDRLVKRAFSSYGGNRYDARLQIVTKRPITAEKNEIVFNPRARSAKLRVAQRK